MPTVVRLRDCPVERWRNGGGVTRLVAVSAPDRRAGPDDWDWRVSIADIERDGPFSSFPGVDRVLTLLDGELALTVDGEEHRVSSARPLAFPGDRTTGCRLMAGPARVVNVMTRRDRCYATVQVLPLPATVGLARDGAAVVLALSERVEVADQPAESLPLGRLDSLVLDDGPLRLPGDGRVLVATLTPIA